MNTIEPKYIYQLLFKAGRAISEIYKDDDFGAELKSDNSPVTRADKASSKIINRGLKERYPNIPIIDEENVIAEYEKRKNWPYYFLIDPLDGTKEFIKRNGEFCINLALIKEGKPELGWIYQPLTKKGWFCKKNNGIVEFDTSCVTKRVDPVQTKSEVIRIVASRSFFKPIEAELIAEIEKSFPVKIIHKGSSLKQIELISGKAEMYLKAGPCSEWDTAPGQLLVEESGGTVFQIPSFEPVRYNKPVLVNPYFIMLNAGLNSPRFIDFIRKIVAEKLG